MRGPAFFAYANNYLVDVKFGIIVDVEASRAIRQAEVDAAKTMIGRTEERFGLKPEHLAADTAYGSAETLNWIVNEKKIAPHIPVIDKSKREDGSLSREDFSFDQDGNAYVCPQGKLLHTTGRIHDGATLLYRAKDVLLWRLSAEAQMLPKGAGAQNPAQHLRRRSRCRPCTRGHRSVQVIAPRPQARRDAVRPSQAHPEAWSPPVARPMWRARRVHARSHRTEPTPARQTGRPTTTTGGRVCCVTVAGVSATASKPPSPMGAWCTGRFKKSLQLRRPPRSPTSATKSALSGREQMQRTIRAVDARSSWMPGRR